MEFLDRDYICWLIKMTVDRFLLADSVDAVCDISSRLKTGNTTSSVYKTIQEPSTCHISQYRLWFNKRLYFDVIRQVSQDCQLVVARFFLKVTEGSCVFLSFNSMGTFSY
jgi:hypothetical protein